MNANELNRAAESAVAADLARLDPDPRVALRIANELWKVINEAMQRSAVHFEGQGLEAAFELVKQTTLLRKRLLEAYKAHILAQFEQVYKASILRLLSRTNGLKHAINGLHARRTTILAWYSALGAPDRDVREIRDVIDVQHLDLLSPEIRARACAALYELDGSFSFPLDEAAREEVLTSLNLPIASLLATPAAPHPLIAMMRDLGLFDLLRSDLAADLEQRVTAFATDACARAGDMDPALPACLAELDARWFPRFAYALHLDTAAGAAARTYRDLVGIALTTVLAARTSRVFDLVALRPAFDGVVADLQTCLAARPSDTAREVAKAARVAFKARLMHPGAMTADLVDMFARAVPVFCELAPRDGDVLLHAATRDLRGYLRSRADLVPCILQLLFDGDNRDVMLRGGAIVLDSDERRRVFPVSGDAGIDLAAPWTPLPLFETQAAGGGGKKKKLDTLAILVNIYGAKDAFVVEYQKRLAAQLLDYDAEEPVDLATHADTVEKLKRRFGDRLLAHCEGMLRDVRESARIEAQIREDKVAQENPVHATIISRELWPEMRSDPLVVHPDMAPHFDAINSAFQSTKASRSLVFLAAQGRVDLELELDNGHALAVSCTPAQATVLAYFQTAGDNVSLPSHTASHLASITKLPEPRARAALQFWVRNGILERGAGHTYVLRCFAADDDASPASTAAAAAATPAAQAMLSGSGYLAPHPHAMLVDSPSSPTPAGSSSSGAGGTAAGATAAADDPLAALTAAQVDQLRQFVHVSVAHVERSAGAVHTRLAMIMHQNKPTLAAVQAVLDRMVKAGEVEVTTDGTYRAVASG
ncbi:hypothetical protein H9P43_001315 [Blastocladiella emersonii ATCC 22665]|nr:hypothetical protein H9P43_001315 [Blastocladiella emersonii ATCC 22665]